MVVRAVAQRSAGEITRPWRPPDAGLKQEVEALRVSILAAARAPTDAPDPTLREFAFAAFEQGRIAENAVAHWRDSVSALFAALEARGYVEREPSEGSASPAPVAGPSKG